MKSREFYYGMNLQVMVRGEINLMVLADSPGRAIYSIKRLYLLWVYNQGRNQIEME